MNQKKAYLKSSVMSLVLMMVMLFAMSITAAAAAPTDVRQTDDDQTYVKVEWTGVAGATYYGVQAATDPGFTNIVYQNNSSLAWASINQLAAGSTYYVRVGWGTKYNNCYANFSAPIEVVTRPASVGTVKFVGANDTTATIAWDAVPGANLYYVDYNSQSFPVGDTAIALPYVAGDNSATVRAARVSATTGYVATRTFGGTYVNNLTALTTKIAKGDLGFRNAWTAINSYQIAANFYGHGFQVKVYDAKSGKAKFSGSDTYNSYGSYVSFGGKFKYNTMYKYRARAYVITTDGQKIYGSWSAYRYFVTPEKCKYTQSGKKIKLSWSKLKGVSKIKVQISTKEDSGYKTAATLKGTKTSYTISKYNKKALKKGKTYYVRILYYSGSNKGDIVSQTSAIKIR